MILIMIYYDDIMIYYHYIMTYRIYLVGGLEHDFCFSMMIGNGIIIPIDELIFFRGVGIPPTGFNDFRSLFQPYNRNDWLR